jgi:hypothetical protein
MNRLLTVVAEIDLLCIVTRNQSNVFVEALGD